MDGAECRVDRMNLRRVKFDLRWVVLLCFAWITNVLAERYLTVFEAQKLCFPQADRFEERLIRYTPDQSKVIEKKSGVKVRNLGNRIRIAWQGTHALGVLIVDQVLGKHQFIDYVVAVSPEGKVRQVEILEYRESYGAEIRGAKWRRQFNGKTAASKLRLNDDIYNVSGATISCRNVTEGVRRVLATFELVVRPQLQPPAGRVPGAANEP
jgi:Na+-translocating ferredoxin:NAD+ oxidoreductase RnfG subunit